MKVQGTITEIFDTQEVSDKFKKREVVIKTDDQYPQELLIQFTQTKCEALNTYKVGDSVTIDINLRGRRWTNKEGVDKFFNTIEGWKINNASQSSESEF